ncbi:MAG: HU family DNA-binding protein [Nitrosomonadales bacterium]|nr:HU family DNA-binding protein [Nitrosomonadales bacterium]
MDKIQFIKRIAEMHPQLKAKDAEKTVKVILDSLCGTLAKGGRIEIRGFGSFSLNQLPQKQKSDRRTGFKLKEPAKYIPQFKPSKELCARVSKGSGAEIAEKCQPQPITPDRFNRDVVNDSEPAAIYA